MKARPLGVPWQSFLRAAVRGLKVANWRGFRAIFEEHPADEKDVSFSRAQHEQLLPTISGLGTVGITPVGSSTYFTPDWYGAAGVNVGIPIFEGFKFHAQAAEADLRAKASDEQSRALINRIVRDVRTAWLRANTAQQKMSVTAELLQEANTALDLADARYRLGLRLLS